MLGERRVLGFGGWSGDEGGLVDDGWVSAEGLEECWVADMFGVRGHALSEAKGLGCYNEVSEVVICDL